MKAPWLRKANNQGYDKQSPKVCTPTSEFRHHRDWEQGNQEADQDAA
jgi:hypothetical protein